MNKIALLLHIKAQYDVNPDFPWKKFPDNAVLRHTHHRKWFGLIMTVNAQTIGLSGIQKMDIINIKARPEQIGQLRQMNGILPAYHMNKEHWISVVLDSTLSDKEIYDLIDNSYLLTK